MTTDASRVALADEAVRERITTSGLHQTLFVEAGAGTGKTSQLVDRVLNLVVDSGVALRDIAAITFTEAAASELRDRIRVTFERTAAASEGERRRRCQQAVADADQAAITTLHGFARRLLDEFPLAAGLPPDVTIADEVESQLAAERRWERFVDGLYADSEHETLLERAALTGVELEPRYPNHATLKDVAAILTQSWDRLAPVAERPVEPLADVDFAPFDDAVRELAAVRQTCVDPDDKLCIHLDELLPEMQSLVAVGDPGRKLTLLTRARKWPKSSFGSAKAWGRPGQEVRAYIDAVNDAKDEVARRAGNDVLERMKVLIAREILRAAESRRREGQLEFHDLLVLSRRVLRVSRAARQALHRRYRCLLLDEFQDTDPIQIELAVLIAGAIDGAEPPHAWSGVAVAEGRLFFVGDPKQSIYRFRRADIELFLAARDRFGGDDTLRLSTNFRTVEPVVRWINTLFGELMADEIPGRQPRYEPLVAHRAPSPSGEHRPVVLGGPQHGGRAAELREAEAADVAATVADIAAHPGRWPVLDDASGRWRPARLTDVTILVPARTSVPYLRTALDEVGAPYRLDTGTLVYDTQEIRDVLAAVRAIDDATDEVSVVAALRSPLYGCSDVDLYTYRRGGGRWDPSQPPPHELCEHPVGRAMSHLHGMWQQRWWSRPSDIVERLVRDRHAMLAAFGDERPREVWRRLRFLIDQARAFDDAGGGGLRDFTAWAELQRSGGSHVHEPLLAESDDAAVRVMTVHGAKGLEFPITILSGMTTKPANRRMGANVIWDGDEPEIKIGSRVETDNFDPRAEVEDDMDADEKLRLLYVAATRARDHLVVSCHHKVTESGGRERGDQSYGHRMWEIMSSDERAVLWRAGDDVIAAASSDGEVGDHDRQDGDAGASLGPSTVIDPEQERAARLTWQTDRAALLSRGARRHVVTATGVAAAASATRTGGSDGLLDGSDRADADADADADAGGDDEGAAWSLDSPGGGWRRGRANTAIGRAVHAALQAVPLDVGPGDSIIDGIAAREASLEAMPERAGMVASLVRSALRTDAVALARRHPHHKELYVAAPLGDRVIEGYVDLVIETPGGLIVVDYKTDVHRSVRDVQASLARYELQGAVYVRALELTTSMPVVGCRFVVCRTSGAVEHAIGDLDAARARVGAYVGVGDAPSQASS